MHLTICQDLKLLQLQTKAWPLEDVVLLHLVFHYQLKLDHIHKQRWVKG